MKYDDFFPSNRMTVPMEEQIKNIGSLEEFERKFSSEFISQDTRIGEYLGELLWKYDKNAANVSDKAYLNPSYVGNIVRGKKNNPGRDALIAICLAIGATVDETQHLLKYAGHSPLYVRRKRDVIIWFGLIKKRSIVDVDIDLAKRGFKTFNNEV